MTGEPSPTRQSEPFAHKGPTRQRSCSRSCTWFEQRRCRPAGALCGHMYYGPVVGSSISVRDLRNTVSEVLRRVESGERLTVTVDRRPVAEIVPLRRRRTVPAAEALAIAARHPADRGFPGEVRGLLSGTTDDL